MIIWGFRSMNRVMGQIQYPCPQCRQNSFHTIVRSRRWFTLFFIPIFPFTNTSVSRCNICGLRTQVDNQQANTWFPSHQPQQPQNLPQLQNSPNPQIPQNVTPQYYSQYPQQNVPPQYNPPYPPHV